MPGRQAAPTICELNLMPLQSEDLEMAGTKRAGRAQWHRSNRDLDNIDRDIWGDGEGNPLASIAATDDAMQFVKSLQHLAGALDHAPEWVSSDVDQNTGFVGNQRVEPAQ